MKQITLLKFGHWKIQFGPLGVETGQYPLPLLSLLGCQMIALQSCGGVTHQMRLAVIAAAFGATATLLGCSTYEQRQAVVAQQRAAIAAQDDQTCRSYMAAFGSDGYVQCRANLANQRYQIEMAAEAAWQYGDMTVIGTSMMTGR